MLICWKLLNLFLFKYYVILQYETDFILIIHPKLVYMEIIYNEVVKSYKKFEKRHSIHPEVYVVLLIALIGLFGTYYLFRYDTAWITQLSMN